MSNTKDFNIDDLDDDSYSDIMNAYEPIDIDKYNDSISNNAKSLLLNIIDSVCKNKGIDIDENDSTSNMLKMYAEIETSNLTTLYEMVMWSKHIVKTKMLQINVGGHINDENFLTFMKLSKHTVDLIMQLKLYLKQLNTFFSEKIDETAIKNFKDITSDQNFSDNNDNNKIGIDVHTDYELTQPVRSQRELLKQIELLTKESKEIN